jgi:hypothetical protein
MDVGSHSYRKPQVLSLFRLPLYMIPCRVGRFRVHSPRMYLLLPVILVAAMIVFLKLQHFLDGSVYTRNLLTDDRVTVICI